MKKQFESLDKYKNEIDLGEFMRLHHFVDADRSSRNSPRLENKTTGETFVIKRNSKGHFTYWNPNNTMYKGKTIVDFVLDKYQNYNPGKPFTLGHVRKLLDKYMNSEKFVPIEESRYSVPIENKNSVYFIKEYHELKNLENRDYLHSRKIDDSIIDHPYFKPLIFNRPFIDAKNNKTHMNTAFSIVNFDGIVAISQKNTGFKGAIGERGSGFVATQNYDKTKPLDTIYLNEAIEDSMNHFGLNYENLKDKNIVYLSTEGSVSEEQIFLFNRMVNTRNNAKSITFGFDNDKSGSLFRAKFLGKLVLNEDLTTNKNNEHFQFLKSSVIDVNQVEKEISCIVHLNHPDKSIGMQFISQLDDYLKELNKIYLQQNLSEKDPFSLTINSVNKTESEAQILFPFEQHFLDSFSKMIIEHKFENSMFFQQDIPLTKDFTDDKLAYLGEHPEYLILSQKDEDIAIRIYPYLNNLPSKTLFDQIENIKGKSNVPYSDIDNIYINHSKENKGDYLITYKLNSDNKTETFDLSHRESAELIKNQELNRTNEFIRN